MTRKSGTSCPTIAARGPGRPEGFASETARKTGQSKRSINRAIWRVENTTQEARDLIRGTRLDTGAMLDHLARMEPEDQVPYITDQMANPAPRRDKTPRSSTCPHCGGDLSRESTR